MAPAPPEPPLPPVICSVELAPDCTLEKSGFAVSVVPEPLRTLEKSGGRLSGLMAGSRGRRTGLTVARQLLREHRGAPAPTAARHAPTAAAACPASRARD